MPAVMGTGVIDAGFIERPHASATGRSGFRYRETGAL
jgi:hypothetical protein